MKPFTTIATIVFGLIAIAHLYRLISPFEVVVGGTSIPGWVSVAGLVIATALAVMLPREARR